MTPKTTPWYRWPNRLSENRLEPECWPVLKPGFVLQRGSSIFTLGSCFARNIETHLSDMGFDVPTLNFLAEHPDLATNFSIDALNRYTPPSIYQDLAWTRQIMDRDDTVRMEDIENSIYPLEGGKVVDLHQRSTTETGITPEQALLKRRQFYQLSRHAFTSDALVITLGLIECWFDPQRQLFVELSAALRRRGHSFDFKVLDYPAALSFVQNSIDLINLDARKNILITTSPVPITRTFTSDDVIVANTYSKSVLRAVAGYTALSNDGVDYFPSYENVMLTKSANVWQDDLTHVESAFVGRIMRRVTEYYLHGNDKVDAATDAAYKFMGFVKHRQWKDAAGAWEQVQDSSNASPTAEFHVCAAEFHGHEGRTDAALHHLKLALTATQPSERLAWDFHLRCANVADTLGHAEWRDSHRLRALDAAGPDASRWRNWITKVAKEGRANELDWLLVEAESRFADNAAMLGFVARSYPDTRRQDTQRIYSKLLQLQPPNAEELAKCGMFLLKSGQVDDAIALIPRICSALTTEWTSSKKFAYSLMQLRQYSHAEDLVRKLMEVNARDSNTHYYLARCLDQRGDRNAAMTHAAEAVRLNPNHKTATAMLDRLKKQNAEMTNPQRGG